MAILTSSLDEQFVYRLLPPNVSTLLVLYLVDVLPFLRRSGLAGDAGREAMVRSKYLFSDGCTRWSEARYEGILKRETGQRLGVEIDLVGYSALFLAMVMRDNLGSFDGAM